MARARTVVAISSSDPIGADGLQADLKTFASLGVHGLSAVTSAGDHALGPDQIAAQIDAVLSLGEVDVVKTGSLPDTEAVLAVAERLRYWEVKQLIVDPVLRELETFLAAVRQQLVPLAYVVTPNLDEAAALSGNEVTTWEEMRTAAEAIAQLGGGNVVVMGGKRSGEIVSDLLFDGSDFRDYSAARVPISGVRGAGSTFSAALAATLAKGETLQHSIAAAKAFVTKALQNMYDVGGEPRLHHFYRYWRA